MLLYTFGASRVGNAGFCKYYNSAKLQSFRISNDEDFVSHYPSAFLGYRDTDIPVFISNSAKLTINPSVLKKSISLMDNWLAFIKGEAMRDHARTSYFEALEKIGANITVDQK